MPFSPSRKQAVLKLFAALLLGAHFFLSLRAATQLSPTWDEIAYPYSGYVQLTTGSLRHYPYNPFLSRLLYGAPFLFTTVETKPSMNPSADGFEFTFHRHESPQKIILLGRLMPAIFSVLTALLLFLWTRRRWGLEAGLLGLAAYLTTPIFLSRASLALVEMPMYFFLALALIFHERSPVASGLAMGLSLLCKLTALPALAALFILYALTRRFKEALVLAIMAVAVVLIGYLPWDGGIDALRIALADLFHFNKAMPYYFLGQYHQNAPGFISLIAFLLKAPLFTLPVGVWGFAQSWKKPALRSSLLPFLSVSLAYVFFGTLTSAPVSTVQLAPIYLGLVVACATVERKAIILGLLALSALDVYRTYPNHLAYFNGLVGGTERGHYWLADSDQDWGQSLPALGGFVKKNPEVLVFLSYSGAGLPEAYGIPYVDVFSPGLASRGHVDAALPDPSVDKKMYFILGTKVAQSYAEAFHWLLTERRPIRIVASTFLVYDVSRDAEFFAWLTNFYGETRRKDMAAWSALRDTALRK